MHNYELHICFYKLFLSSTVFVRVTKLEMFPENLIAGFPKWSTV